MSFLKNLFGEKKPKLTAAQEDALVFSRRNALKGAAASVAGVAITARAASSPVVIQVPAAPAVERELAAVQTEEIKPHKVPDVEIPIGTLFFIHPDASAPPDWCDCDGREFFRAAHPELFAAMGTNYGEGDGVLTFNVPNDQDEWARQLSGNYRSPFNRGPETELGGQLTKTHPRGLNRAIVLDDAEQTGPYVSSETRPRNVRMKMIIKISKG